MLLMCLLYYTHTWQACGFRRRRKSHPLALAEQRRHQQQLQKRAFISKVAEVVEVRDQSERNLVSWCGSFETAVSWCELHVQISPRQLMNLGEEWPTTTVSSNCRCAVERHGCLTTAAPFDSGQNWCCYSNSFLFVKVELTPLLCHHCYKSRQTMCGETLI